jgi:hypothetical protein
MLMHLDQVPVVKTSATDRLFVHPKAERMDEMEGAVRCRAEASDVPRIGGDLGLDEDDVEGLGSRRGTEPWPDRTSLPDRRMPVMGRSIVLRAAYFVTHEPCIVRSARFGELLDGSIRGLVASESGIGGSWRLVPIPPPC